MIVQPHSGRFLVILEPKEYTVLAYALSLAELATPVIAEGHLMLPRVQEVIAKMIREIEKAGKMRGF